MSTERRCEGAKGQTTSTADVLIRSDLTAVLTVAKPRLALPEESAICEGGLLWMPTGGASCDVLRRSVDQHYVFENAENFEILRNKNWSHLTNGIGRLPHVLAGRESSVDGRSCVELCLR